MLIYKIWEPDVCLCKIRFKFDDEAPDSYDKCSADSMIETCENHAALETAEAIYAAVQEECMRKEQVLGALLAAYPSLCMEGDESTWDPQYIAWQYSEDRTLYVTIDPARMTPEEKESFSSTVPTITIDGPITLQLEKVVIS